MIGFGVIVKSIALSVAAAASRAESRLDQTISALSRPRRRPIPILIPATRRGRDR